MPVHNKSNPFKEKVVTSMRPKSWGAGPVNVCLHITRITKRHCKSQRKLFLYPRTYFHRRSNYPSHWFSGIRKYVPAREKVLGFTFTTYIFEKSRYNKSSLKMKQESEKYISWSIFYALIVFLSFECGQSYSARFLLLNFNVFTNSTGQVPFFLF